MWAFKEGRVIFINKWSLLCLRENEEDENQRDAPRLSSRVTDKLLKALFQQPGAEAKLQMVKNKMGKEKARQWAQLKQEYCAEFKLCLWN